MATIDTALDAAIYAKIASIANISTLAPGGIHNTVRPQGSDFPCIVFTHIGGPGIVNNYSASGHEVLDYDFRVIGRADDQSSVGSIIQAVNTSLERVALTITGHTHMKTLLVRRIPPYFEVDPSGTYVTRGVTMRFWMK